MTRIKVKGFQIFDGRHNNGKQYCYHRKTGERIDLERYPLGSVGFFAECARINALLTTVAPKPGTLGLLVAAYKGDSVFADLAPRTRADYQRVFDYLKPIGDTALLRFDKPLIVRIRDKAASKHGRRQGNYVKAVLSLLFAWGMERGFVLTNPASGIKTIRRKKGLPEANRPWSDEERHVVLDRLPAHMKLPVGLMMFAGLGPKDALKLPRSFFKDGEIATRRSKTGEPVYWPCPAPLVELIRDAPAHNAIMLCANSYGRPWTESGFNASWRPIKLELEREGAIGSGLTLYGLRHTVAVIMRELGFDERTIADALGQKTIEMARHYAKGADLKPKMRGVVKSLDAAWNERKTKAVKPTE
jgi:integrase